ncbi:Platelet-activating factor acetylhydrolase, plasma/intracellular isoform II protein [Acanthamoeba castellanii str. Neff]|uniref:1-alkyl-2-acetylglycerophosphocholine esterase n=1 Tax=Acanthamoeba castellanii (strain ATCC 30010 / Neff) TaxID=1257118 RepID=L8HKG1_ACACF|nr:Platelet-activating factor acetylhydrolase, plasma/intracellular isoform II protein [Acanthamoeba castellanii str. Neff]ELR25148.1 Platelet-activating factor acetylhydrolase, plasma/intracellular isoform II protein [Acanthamoeba castellanii str. Neff]
MPGHSSLWWWGVAAALQVLRRSPAEALVWTTTVAALALRGAGWSSISGTSSTDGSSTTALALAIAPLGVLAWQTGLRGGFLWQLVPLVPVIAAPLLPAVLSAVPWPSSGPAWWAAWGVGWLLAAASLAALLAFPPVPFPPRTAPRTRDLDAAASGARSAARSAKLYDVGFRHGEEDEGDERGRRAFYVWYPAARGSRTTSHKSRGDSGTSHYFPQFTSQMEAMFESMQYRLPTALLFSHLRYVHPNTLADAPLLPAPCAPSTEAADDGGPRWPAIVFSHGLYGFPSLYTHLCSSLASLGYVVVAVGHTDGSGSIVSPARGDILTAFEPLPTSPSGQELGGHDLWKFRNRQLDVRVDDLEACLDTLHRWNSDTESPFYGTAVDLAKVAVAGHSFGGGTSLGLVLREAESRSLASCGKSAAERNTSVRGAILFDGWMFPLKGSEGPAFDRVIPPQRFDASVPVLFINAEMWHGSEPYFMLNKERIGQLCELSKGRWRSFTLKGTGHHNWNDFCFYAPIVSRLVGLTRERDLTEAHDDTMALVDAFLADVLTDDQDATSDELPRLPRLDRAVSAILRENPSHEDAVLEVDAAPGRHRNDSIASKQQQ